MRMTRVALRAALIVTACASCPPALADVEYSFAVSGTLSAVDGVRGNVYGETFNLLPGLSVGDPFSASGTFRIDGVAITQTSLIGTVGGTAPGAFTFESISGPIGGSFDPAHPEQGFNFPFIT